MESSIEPILRLQATIKAYLTRRTYGIKCFPEKDLTDYPLYILGNDPEITGLSVYPVGETLALVGTSGFRSLFIAYALSEGITKLIILDNSRYVTGFWRAARNIIEISSDSSIFLASLKNYLVTNHFSVSGDIDLRFTEIALLMRDLDFDKTRQIITRTVVIGQSWANQDLMVKLKNILSYNKIQKIYAYPSNIVAYMDKLNGCETDKILQNIQVLNPVIAIHSDMINQRPRNIFLLNNHDPACVKAMININPGIFSRIKYTFFSRKPPKFDKANVIAVLQITLVSSLLYGFSYPAVRMEFFRILDGIIASAITQVRFVMGQIHP